jgi:hypothetical protein
LEPKKTHFAVKVMASVCAKKDLKDCSVINVKRDISRTMIIFAMVNTFF